MAALSFSRSLDGLLLHENPLIRSPNIAPHKRNLRLRVAHSEKTKNVDAYEIFSKFKELKHVACGLLAVWSVSTASPVLALNQRLPPLSTEPNRCERAFIGNTIGQANGVYDKPIDLRFCDYTNDKSNLKGKSLAAALMSDAKFDGADMSEVVMSKAYAVGASFKGVDFSNAVLDRVNFGKADLEGAVFKNAVLSGSTFDDAKLDGVVFEDTIIGYIDLQKLCANRTINAEGRSELGCSYTVLKTHQPVLRERIQSSEIHVVATTPADKLNEINGYLASCSKSYTRRVPLMTAAVKNTPGEPLTHFQALMLDVSNPYE